MKDQRLAVLIDADNVPYSNIKEMLEEIAKNGTPTIKRIYADWTKPTVSGWKNVLLEHAITPIQQYSYTTVSYTHLDVYKRQDLSLYFNAK